MSKWLGPPFKNRMTQASARGAGCAPAAAARNKRGKVSPINPNPPAWIRCRRVIRATSLVVGAEISRANVPFSSNRRYPGGGIQAKPLPCKPYPPAV